MPRLFIPEIGTVLRLTEPWIFTLHNEYRNQSLVDFIGDSGNVTFPAGSRIKVDRIYIRQGNQDFSSLTFRLVTYENDIVRGVRFWVKLRDVNRIEYEIEEERTPQSSRPMTTAQKEIFDRIVELHGQNLRNGSNSNPFGYPHYQDPPLRGKLDRMIARGWIEKRRRTMNWRDRQAHNWYYNHSVHPTQAGIDMRARS